MPIWTHGETNQRDQTRPRWMAVNRDERFELTMRCRYCASLITPLAGKIETLMRKGMNASDGALFGCATCGWWMAASLRAAAPYETHDGGFAELRQISGVLKNLDLTDLSIPLHELRSYLVARYGDRFNVGPRRYEEIVGGVFSDFGYRVRVTSYSGDEGIDVFVLDGKDDTTVGVQVKRYRNKISAEQIRAFVGALALKGLTTGVYVTTSDYEKGAKQAAAAAESRLGIGITLLDAKRFYEALKISARATLWDAEDSASPYYECWQRIQEYVNGPTLPDRQQAEWWLETADYVWGSSW